MIKIAHFASPKKSLGKLMLHELSIDDKIGLIAGSGALPEQIIKSCISLNKKIFVIALEGSFDKNDSLQNVPHIILNISEVGKAIDSLRKQGIKHIIMAGGIKRPQFSQLKPDLAGVKLLAQISAAKLRGDNSLLVTVIKFFESMKFVIIGVDQLLQEVLIPHGKLGRIAPDRRALADIQLGKEIARQIGNLDIGQGVVVQNGVVLGIEAIEGTDALLERCGSLRLENAGGVLVKMKKPMQDTRIDLPAIGVDTVINAHKAGLCGIAIESGSALVIEKAEVAAAADKLRMFVVGV